MSITRTLRRSNRWPEAMDKGSRTAAASTYRHVSTVSSGAPARVANVTRIEMAPNEHAANPTIAVARRVVAAGVASAILQQRPGEQEDSHEEKDHDARDVDQRRDKRRGRAR